MKDLLYYETTPKGEKQTSIYTASVLEDYIIWINSVIEDDLAQEVIVTIRHLNKKDKNKPIKVFINSPGGSVSAGLAIYDCLNLITNPVYTIGIGTCASMAAFLLICAGKKRYASENCSIMLHQPLINSVGGQATDIQIVAENIIKVKSRLNEIIAKKTKISVEKITAMSDRDLWLEAEEAVKLGMIDEILTAETFSK